MLRRATLVAGAGTAGLAVGVGVVPVMGAGPASFVGGPGAAEREEQDPAERLVDQHDCWTGDAPGSAVPGRAVVTLPGRQATVTASSVGFELWLGPDGVPDTGDERAGQLHAFCR